jgi:hypothetical protein
MRRIRILSALILAVGVTGVFAAPAFSMSGLWIEEEKVLVGSSETIELEGTVTRGMPGYFLFSCSYEAEATLFEGDTGEVTSFEFIPGSCEGAAYLAGCKLKEASTSAPWPIQISEGSRIDISEVSFDWKFSSCPVPNWTFEGKLGLIPDGDPEKISSYLLYTLEAKLGFPAAGPGTVTPAGVYGMRPSN